MSLQSIESKRNIAVIGHGGVGKTSLLEVVLHRAGATTRIGSTTEGTSHFDFEPEEIKRGSTLKTAVFDFSFQNTSFTALDTPGSSNFIADTICALRAADSALLVVGAKSGLKVSGEKAWNFATQEKIARAIFINELDKERADFSDALDEIENTLEITPLVIHLPIGREASLRGVIDLLEQKTYLLQEDGSESISEEVPSELQAEFEERRTALIEAIAESDDQLIEKYLDGKEISTEELVEAFRRGFHGGEFVPVFCGSAGQGVGIRALLDNFFEYFPSPLERQPYRAINELNQLEEVRPDDPRFSAIVFKTFADPFTGKISLVRIVSGELESDSNVFNVSTNSTERTGKLHAQLGKEQQTIASAGPGAIVALAKLKDTRTGHTLTSSDKPVRLLDFEFPESCISYAVEPKSRGDEEKILSSIEKIALEDPEIHVMRDPSTHETLISGMGQDHIEITLERMKRKFNVEVVLHAPKVPYRETITSPAEAQGKHKKQTGGRGQYGDCWIRIQPKTRGEGYAFHSEIFGGAIPKNYIPAVEKGVQETMNEGCLAGYPMVDIDCTVYDGSFHPVDSSDLAFKIAASKGLKAAVEKARPVLLEPIMISEIVVPDESTGDVIGDLNSRRGKVVDMEPKGKYQVIRAKVPMAEMLNYAPDLRSMTADRGSFHLEFEKYEEVPSHVAQKVIHEKHPKGTKEGEKNP